MSERGKTSVYITVDTESSMGGAWQEPSKRPLSAARHVFCQNQRGAFGIPLIVQELQRHGFRATFFCEMLATHVLGEADTRSITDFLLAAGQDVQLHLHPTYWHYHLQTQNALVDSLSTSRRKSDLLSAHSSEEQEFLLDEACQIFRRCTGRWPAAFRAGNFAANQTTLQILAKRGILIDSSFNPAYVVSHFFDEQSPAVNLVQFIGGVWEFPIMVAKTRFPEGNGYKPFDLCALCNAEMETILNIAHETGMEHVTLIFHCFSLVKPKDVSYSSFKPNRIVIGRLQKLLRFLDRESSKFMVRTFGEIATVLPSQKEQYRSVLPDLGFWRGSLRKAVQGLNHFYWT